jgi:NTE family protein
MAEPRSMTAPRRALAVLGVVALLAAGCASSQVEMNQPLSRAADGRPDFAQNYGIDRIEREMAAAPWRSELLVLLAFSGGGKRSAAFAHGVLRGLREVPVVGFGGPPRRLLDDVGYISAVSGGSFPAVHYGLHRARSFETFHEEFLYQDINGRVVRLFLLPWNWEWLVNPLFGTNDYMARLYDRLMFRGARYEDLARQGAPLISVNATDIANGVPFVFLGPTFGLLCSDLNRFLLARAVAASNGFPVLFSPITLENHAARCGGARPWTPPPVPRDADDIEAERRAELARLADAYADPERNAWVHLLDGGISDNLALRGLLQIILGLEEDSEPLRQLALRSRRLLVISVDGQAAADQTLGQQRVVSGLLRVLSAVSGTQIDTMNFETRAIMREQTRRMVRRFRSLRCAAPRAEVRGRCEDVEGEFIHLALSDIEDAEVRARLQAIPTGLTVARADVDALVAYGERLVAAQPRIRALTEEAAPAPVARARR